MKIVDKVAAEGGTALTRFKLDFSKIEVGRTLGEGSFGTVVQGTYKGLDVAIKLVRATKVDEGTVRAFMDEIRIMAPLQHPNLVGLHGGCWESADQLCIVLEYCSRGALDGLIRMAKHAEQMTWASPFRGLATGIARCFVYLHHEQPDGVALIHRDLKPANVLIDDHGAAKVADFGESRRFDAAEARKTGDGSEAGNEAMSMTIVGRWRRWSRRVYRA